MSALLLALSLLLATPDPLPLSPNDVWETGFLNLQEGTKPADQPYTRYLSNHVVGASQRDKYLKILTLAANSTSYRAEFGRPELVAGDLLIKLDLRAFAWDYPSRVVRLAELERRGANFNLKDPEARRLFLDPWEQLAKLDPYFQTDTHYTTPGHVGEPAAGWIDPRSEKAARLVSRSLKFMLRSDWVVGRLLQEKEFGGIYSDLLMIPRIEDDFYKTLLIDIKAFERDNYLLKGGAVLGGGEGGVALNNRELQLLPSPYGGYYWRTFDVNVDTRFLLDANGQPVLDANGKPVPKSIFEALRGTLAHDGREAIGTLPNKLHWYRLDGAPKPGKTTGVQAAVVPENIAQVKEPLLPVKETRVINSYKCLECHLPNNGIYPFDDVVRKTYLVEGQFNLAAYSYKDQGLEAALNDYYSSKLGQIIDRQRDDFAAALRDCCGMTGTEAATQVVGAIENYTHDLVTPQQAAVEMGLTLAAARVAWLGSKNPQLFALAAGTPIRRAAWEQSFADGMRAVHYQWETKPHAPAPHRLPARPVPVDLPANIRRAA